MIGLLFLILLLTFSKVAALAVKRKVKVLVFPVHQSSEILKFICSYNRLNELVFEKIMERSPINPKTLYNVDYLQWINQTLTQLKNKAYGEVDWDNLIEELEDMGRSERRALESNLIIVLLHLLKWQYQPDKRTGSWESSLIEHRRRIRKALKESPSLTPFLEKILIESYQQAIKQAKAETGLPKNRFPPQCPYDLVSILDDEFLP